MRTRVHEYGGGAFTFGKPNVLYYSEFATQRVMQLDMNNNEKAEPVPMTPDCDNCRYRFADGDYDAANDRLVMIREDHTQPAPKDVVNQVVCVNTKENSSDEEPQVLATGNDFYLPFGNILTTMFVNFIQFS